MKITTLFAVSATLISTTFAANTVFAKNLKAKTDSPQIQINSFRIVGTNTELAELCGRVTGPNASYNLRVIADDATNNPGDYHTTSGKNGNFCTLIATYAGTAKVELEE